jgi:hypothetical protein
MGARKSHIEQVKRKRYMRFPTNTLCHKHLGPLRKC